MTDTGCQQCEADTYSGDAATECTPCSGGMISAAGSSSEDDCQYGLLNHADNMHTICIQNTINPTYKIALGFVTHKPAHDLCDSV